MAAVFLTKDALGPISRFTHNIRKYNEDGR